MAAWLNDDVGSAIARAHGTSKRRASTVASAVQRSAAQRRAVRSAACESNEAVSVMSRKCRERQTMTKMQAM